jgi:flavoprotein hydroxylase
VVERWPQPYPLPRAVGFDSESARILAAAGVADALDEFAEPSGDYAWYDGEGRTLLRVEGAARGWCGWPNSAAMYQPGLEAALAARGARLPTLRVLRGWSATALAEHGDRVELTAQRLSGQRLPISARWLVGCDGANSFVRSQLGITSTDLGFSHEWLICDVIPHEPRAFRPNNLLVCDPARPRTAVSAGPGYRRWEFMRLPGETAQELDTAEMSWRLLAPFDITPQNATLVRHDVYTFEARWADEWRVGRMLLAGDAAHVMPPFTGQGMCSGFRDAANLAWKLDLVLAGLAGEHLLDTYTVERRRHVQYATRMSVELGRIICQTDAAAATERHKIMLAARRRGIGTQQATLPIHPLREGLLGRVATGAPAGLTGLLTPQARVARQGAVGLFDSVVGNGFVLAASRDPDDLLDADRIASLKGIGAHLVHVVPPDTAAADRDAVVDVDNVYLPYLAGAGSLAVLWRPDFYVFGAAATRTELVALVDDLRDQLTGSGHDAPLEQPQAAGQ